MSRLSFSIDHLVEVEEFWSKHDSNLLYKAWPNDSHRSKGIIRQYLLPDKLMQSRGTSLPVAQFRDTKFTIPRRSASYNATESRTRRPWYHRKALWTLAEMTLMKHARFSMFSLVVLLPVIVATLFQILSNCWHTLPRVQWEPASEMLENEEKNDGILLVSYYSSADVTSYYPHEWMTEHGGSVIRRYRIQPYALDQVAASSKQEALIARMFKRSTASTGIGVVDLRGEEPRSKWCDGAFATEDGFEQWVVEFIDRQGS